MILTDARGNKYWAHFRHVPEHVTAGALLTINKKRTDEGHIVARALVEKIKHKQPEFEVTFWRTECSLHAGKCPNMDRPRGTACSAPSLHGHADCSPLDTFLRYEGRKGALQRALETLPRELRAELWASYFEQRRRHEPYKHPAVAKNHRAIKKLLEPEETLREVFKRGMERKDLEPKE